MIVRIRQAAIALAESLPSASVLGDVDALAARLSAITEQAGQLVDAQRAQRDLERLSRGTRRRHVDAELLDRKSVV